MKAKVLKALVACTAMAAMIAMGSVSVMAEEAVTEAAQEAEEEDEENYETGDASLDDIRNQDEIGENEILVVSFGTSYNDSKRLTIGGIENAIAEAFPDWSVRRGFTAQIVIDHVERRDGLHIDNVSEALERAIDNGVKTLIVQPTHLMAGSEYEELEETLAEYADSFDTVVLGANLLDTDEDFAKVEQVMVDIMADYDDGETAIVYMGHGTEHESNEIYAKMQELLAADGYENYYVGTVEAEPSVDDVLAAIEEKGYTKVVLHDMMVVAGDHAHNDMADPEDPESWYSTFAAAGYEVEALLDGLGEVPEIQQMYVEKVQASIDALE